MVEDGGEAGLVLEHVIIALLLKAGRRGEDLVPGVDVLSGVGVAGLDLRGGDIELGRLGQKRVAHVHMVQDHERRRFAADVFDLVGDGELVARLRAGDRAGEDELFREDPRVAHSGLDPDLLVVHVPGHALRRDIADRAVQRQADALIRAGRADGEQTAGSQEARREVLEPAVFLVVVIGRGHVAVGREKAAVLPAEDEAGDIRAAVGGDGKFQPLAVADLQQAHAVALAALQPDLLHAEQLGFVSVIRALIHVSSPFMPGQCPRQLWSFYTRIAGNSYLD